MLPKNNSKKRIPEQKLEQKVMNKYSNFKNLCTKIRKNIKTSFPRIKEKNSLSNLHSSKLTDNRINKINNINSFFINLKKDESRNYNTNINHKEDFNDFNNGANFNKTQKNIDPKDPKLNAGKKIYFHSNLAKEVQKDFNSNNSHREKNIKLSADKKQNKSRINEEDKSKLLSRAKLSLKEEILKTKNLYEKVKSARLGYNDKELNLKDDNLSEIKTESNNKIMRIDSQNEGKLNDKDCEFDTIKIMKIRRKKYMKLGQNNSKNLSMNINENKLLLNNKFISSKCKTKKKYSIANIFNFSNDKESIKKKIPFDKDSFFNSSEKKQKQNNDDEENNFRDNTCINFNHKIKKKLNYTMNNTNGKQSSTIDNNSFKKMHSQKNNNKNYYPKPISQLKKRIFNSPSDQDILNNLKEQENDSLEIGNKINQSQIFKELLIFIKSLNQIINAQKSIINEYISNERKLRKELEEKDIQIKNYKNVCFKLLFYLDNEKENAFSNNNKKKNIIFNQIIQENNILKNIISFSVSMDNKYIHSNNEKGKKLDFDINGRSFYNSNNNQEEKNKCFNEERELFQIKSYNEENNINNNHIKKREKSYENRKNKNKDSVS